ncbi:MAG: hypothetical protein QXL15_01825, partial [Candidatus Korarchaeota archaeon]
EDMRSLILIVAFLHQEDITTNNYLNLSILKQLQEAKRIGAIAITDHDTVAGSIVARKIASDISSYSRGRVFMAGRLLFEKNFTHSRIFYNLCRSME